MGRGTYIKGVTVRFGFDVSESCKLNVSQKQSNGDALRGVLHALIGLWQKCPMSWWLKIHRRGAFSVARFERQGNARAQIRGTSDMTGSTLFSYTNDNKYTCLGVGKDDMAVNEEISYTNLFRSISAVCSFFLRFQEESYLWPGGTQYRHAVS